jgi:hypothetical protein
MIAELKKAFTFKATIEEKENVYIPKIQSTYTPPKADFNEVFAGVHEQLKLKYERRED